MNMRKYQTKAETKTDLIINNSLQSAIKPSIMSPGGIVAHKGLRITG